jgi:hypothetical protein
MRAGPSFRASRAAAIAAVLLLLAAGFPRAAGAQAQQSGSAIPLTAPAKPENPYSRFAIVSLGSFPIMIFYTDFAIDMGNMLLHLSDPNYGYYAPWPFKTQLSYVPPDTAPIGRDSKAGRLAAALGACLVVGAIDAYIHANKVKKAQRLRDAAASLGDAAALPSDEPKPPPGSPSLTGDTARE